MAHHSNQACTAAAESTATLLDVKVPKVHFVPKPSSRTLVKDMAPCIARISNR